MRTAAASGLATRLLARPEARTVGIFGTGVQAATHLEAMMAVRPIESVLVWGRTPEKAKVFAEQQSGLRGVPVRTATAEETAGCDLVCTVTGSPEPVVRGEWVSDGAHINLVGAHSPNSREADTALVVRGRVYVDSLESTLNEGGDLLIPMQEGAIDKDHIVGEIGRLVTGDIPGRQTPRDVTIYNSLGIVGQDLVAAYLVYRRAQGELQG
jgi:ornithine cyclodeaminase